MSIIKKILLWIALIVLLYIIAYLFAFLFYGLLTTPEVIDLQYLIEVGVVAFGVIILVGIIIGIAFALDKIFDELF